MECPKCKETVVEKYGRIPLYHPSFLKLKKHSLTKNTKLYRYFHCPRCKGNFAWTKCIVEIDLKEMKVLRAYL